MGDQGGLDEGTGPDRQDEARELLRQLIAGGLTPGAELQRPTRSGPAAEGFDAAAYASANLLEVHFDDGSVFYTDPASFAESQVAPPALRTGPADARTVRLPFQLRADGDAPALRGGPAAIPIERYRLARLTEPTWLDRAYAFGDTVMRRLDSWLGARPGGEAPHTATAAGPLAAFKLCRLYEDATLQVGLGERDGLLLRWTGSAWVAAQPADGAATAASAPTRGVLLLLHGTASCTAASFGGLWRDAAGPGDDWHALARDPDRLVLAFEHRSLTASPVRNVLDLLDQLQALGLPGDCRIDWVGHSRGGLVGELLALALGSAPEVRARAAVVGPAFEASFDEPHAERALVLQFLQRLRSAERLPGWTPGTFVRVACPARGTLLADRRTDFFLSLLLRSVGLAFGVNGNPWFEPLQNLVRALVASRADARRIPGLESMIPGAPLSLALNRLPPAADGGLTLPGRLRVVAGVTQGFGPGGLASMLGNVFYGLHDHDFVVHTHSMFGGFARSDALSCRVEHRELTHFSYFRADAAVAGNAAGRPRTRAHVLAALRGDDSGFRALTDDEAATRGLWQQLAPAFSRWSRQRWLDDLRAADAPRMPILVVLPGIMGSELSHVDDGAGKPVWLSAGSMFSGALRDLDLDAGRALKPTGMMPLSYERLLARARTQFHVVTFPYDWRQPVPQAAGELVDLLGQLLPEAERLDMPVHLLAHSMGGLVARLALWCPEFGLEARRGDLTRRLEARGLRLLQCGTPNRGSYAPVQLLLQQHPLTRSIAIAARGVDPSALARFGARYPGLLAMLPDEPDGQHGDLFKDETWERIRADEDGRTDDQPRITPPDCAVLAEARRVRDWLRTSFEALKDNPRVFYVAGQGLTPLGLKRLGGRPAVDGRRAVAGVLRLGVTQSGDGTVPWNSRLLPERTWYLRCEHGSLLDDPEAFDGYFELLHLGRTTRLARTPPATRGPADDADRLFDLPVPASLAADPVAYVLGMRPPRARLPLLPPIAVRVVHGSLDYARHPLLVGHYADEGVYGSVLRVDVKLGGQFTRQLRLGLFVGAAGSSTYLRDAGVAGAGPVYPGAIVVGLGRVNEINPSALVDAVMRGVLDHAFEHHYQDAWARGAGELRLRLSAVLIGAHLQALSVRDSLTAVLTGVWRAALVLADEDTLPRRVVIDEVEIVELHESVALDAAYALHDLLQRPEWPQRYVWPAGVLEAREGGVRGYRPPNEAALWQRLVVRSDSLGALEFDLVADRARVESTQNRADVFSVREFVAKAADSGATRSSDAESRELGRMLFNLLLPQALKARLANFRRTVLLLDDDTARWPWELLAPPLYRAQGDESAQPLAVQAGLVRQRLSGEFRDDHRPLLRGPGDDDGILVVGDPDTRGWVDERQQALEFRELLAAAAEARAVARLFESKGWTVTPLIRGSGTGEIAEGPSYKDLHWQIMRPQPWRVLHLAGHGMVDLWQRTVDDDGVPRRQCGTGMVLGQQQMLTAAMVEQMDPAPEFVFINCCYSAADGTAAAPTGRNLPAIAASLALAFIRMGSRAVVAAGWRVQDADGELFARSLYGELFNGVPFGDAVLAARQALWSNGSARSNTWGAYQCYGDPHWTLQARRGGGPASASNAGNGGNGGSVGGGRSGGSGGSGALSGAWNCMSPRELADRIEQVGALAGDGAAADNRRDLDQLLDALKADPARRAWLDDSQVLAALGTAWRELDQPARALEAFIKAGAAVHSQIRLEQMEWAANLISRLPRHPPDPEFAKAAMEGSISALDRIDRTTEALHEPGGPAPESTAGHGERACLRGSAFARRARLDGLAPDERAALELEAAKAYAAGYRRFTAHAAAPGKRAYALSRAVLCAAMAALRSPPRREDAVVQASWWGAQAASPATGSRRRTQRQPGGVDAALAAIDPVLDALAADAGQEFWVFASQLDLRIARLTMRLALKAAKGAKGGLEGEDTRELAALDRILETALLCWPSPSQLASFGDPLRRALDAVAAYEKLKVPVSPLADALRRLIERVEDASRLLGD